MRLSDHLCQWRRGVCIVICPSLALEHPSHPPRRESGRWPTSSLCPTHPTVTGRQPLQGDRGENRRLRWHHPGVRKPSCMEENEKISIWSGEDGGLGGQRFELCGAFPFGGWLQ